MNTSSIGNEGEKIAADYLKCNGYEIIALNYKAAGGEIDIVAQNGKHLAFVEVKTRKDTKFGYASDAVNYTKQQRIIRAARAFLVKYCDFEHVSFDVCEVYTLERRINYIVNAFEAQFCTKAYA